MVFDKTVSRQKGTCKYGQQQNNLIFSVLIAERGLVESFRSFFEEIWQLFIPGGIWRVG